MKTYRLAVGLALAATALLAGAPMAAEPSQSVFRLQTVSAEAARDGTCFVVHQEERDGATTAWFLTSARLFDREGERRARVFLRDETLEIAGRDITTPYANIRDVALLKARVGRGVLRPLPLTFDDIHAGTLFVVSGYQADGGTASVAQHAAFVASRAVRGERPISLLAGCRGAPAIVERGVFGVVAECEPNHAPEIVPLTVARGFLARELPGMGRELTQHFEFHQESREVPGPTVRLTAGETTEAEVEVPLGLTEREAVFAATARLVSEKPLPEASVTVLDLDDRSVKLRFTVGGPPPVLPAAAWPMAQALVLIRVNVVTVPKF
jgi:hypothetical protein